MSVKLNKICADCDFAKKETMEGPRGFQIGYFCTHQNSRDLVSGDFVPAGVARSNDVYCGPNGKYFKVREKESPVKVVAPEAPVESNLIALAKD